jgi:hypothetical protein
LSLGTKEKRFLTFTQGVHKQNLKIPPVHTQEKNLKRRQYGSAAPIVKYSKDSILQKRADFEVTVFLLTKSPLPNS